MTPRQSIDSVRVEHLSKRYGSTVAVDDLSFTVHPGQVTGFLGPNGAGKSTTMRLMVGLDHGGGRTLYGGRTYRQLDPPATHVGALLETGAYHPARTARDHLRLLVAGAGLPVRRIDAVLDLVGLTEVAEDKPGEFSLGMAQRFGLACALLGDPPVLLLDEPANGLDPQGITWLRLLLRELATQGRAVLVSSHLLQEMQLMADAVIVLGRGRLVAEGSMAEFVASVGGRRVRLRSPEVAVLAAELARHRVRYQAGADREEIVVDGIEPAVLGDLAHRLGARVHGLTIVETSLEEAFLAVTEGEQQFTGRAGQGGAGRTGSARGGVGRSSTERGGAERGGPERGGAGQGGAG